MVSRLLIDAASAALPPLVTAAAASRRVASSATCLEVDVNAALALLRFGIGSSSSSSKLSMNSALSLPSTARCMPADSIAHPVPASQRPAAGGGGLKITARGRTAASLGTWTMESRPLQQQQLSRLSRVYSSSHPSISSRTQPKGYSRVTGESLRASALECGGTEQTLRCGGPTGQPLWCGGGGSSSKSWIMMHRRQGVRCGSSSSSSGGAGDAGEDSSREERQDSDQIAAGGGRVGKVLEQVAADGNGSIVGGSGNQQQSPAAAAATPASASSIADDIFTLPTILTLSRVVAVPALVPAYYVAPNSAAAIFLAASFTDWLDGFLARKMNTSSSFGAFLDPVADKLMVGAALVLLCSLPPAASLPLWLLPIPSVAIIGREIAMSALREWAASQGGRLHEAVAVSGMGKWKTATQMASLTALLVARTTLFSDSPLMPFVTWLGVGLLFVAAALSLWSLAAYFRVIWKVMHS